MFNVWPQKDVLVIYSSIHFWMLDHHESNSLMLACCLKSFSYLSDLLHIALMLTAHFFLSCPSSIAQSSKRQIVAALFLEAPSPRYTIRNYHIVIISH